ncbi:nucleotidyltransferase family protein [Motilimonas pumila]|uniref:Nucleotidyltransferase family protein n=1 Tax=Motilimonas pumila TaxID=2303987 RepID=A0A418YH98_9GAMM|nr:nucleotidyltransferase family protein [Motilimonas pumila]RJG49476.1 hypothetical protein D1Z90_05830 [Motilimonas pumila]
MAEESGLWSYLYSLSVQPAPISDQQLAVANLRPRLWNELLERAEQAQLLAVWHEQLKLCTQVPSVAQTRMQWANTLATQQLSSMHAALESLQQALSPFHPVLLKGAAYQVLQTDNAVGRVMSDIDILLPEQELASAERALWLHGWDNRGKSDYDQSYYRRWMHELPPFIHRQSGAVLDLHHHWLPKTCRWQLNIDNVLQRATKSPITGFKVPCLEDLCIHACLHLLLSGESIKGWRDLRDVHLLCQQVTDENLRARALQLGVLEQVETVKQIALRSFQMGGSRLNWQQKLWQQALIPTKYRLSLIDNHAQNAYYLYGHYLRMPWRLLLPHLIRKARIRLQQKET